MKAGEKNYLRNQMAQRPTVTQMSRKFEGHAFTPLYGRGSTNQEDPRLTWTQSPNLSLPRQ